MSANSLGLTLLPYEVYQLLPSLTHKTRGVASRTPRHKTAALLFAIALLNAPAVSASESAAGAFQIAKAQLVDDIGAAERVEASDLLRTLTQEVPAAACYLFSGIDMDESRRLMVEARDKFDKNLDALLNGDAEMNIIG